MNPSNREGGRLDLYFAWVSVTGTALGALWWILRSHQTGPESGSINVVSILGILGAVCVLAAWWILFLPPDHVHFPEGRKCSPKGPLDEHLKDGELLLAHLEKRGLLDFSDTESPTKQLNAATVLKRLAVLRANIEKNPAPAIGADQQIAFYEALSWLIAKARPVTAESLRDTMGTPEGDRSPGERKLDLQGRVMLLSVILLVLCQAYTAVGLSLYNNLAGARRHYLGLYGISPEPEVPATKPDAAKPVPTAPPSNAEPVLADPNDQRKLAKNEFLCEQSMLLGWVKPVAGLLVVAGFKYETVNGLHHETESTSTPGRDAVGDATQPGTPTPDAGNNPPRTPGPNIADELVRPVILEDFAKTRTQAKLLLDFLNNYLLPLLYGWVGAMVFVVRRLSEQVTAHSYREGEENSVVRIFLGCIAGVAIGWFMPIQTSGTGTAKILTSLTPLALAFLAGFAVEIFFALLDRLVRTFTEQPATKPAK